MGSPAKQTKPSFWPLREVLQVLTLAVMCVPFLMSAFDFDGHFHRPPRAES